MIWKYLTPEQKFALLALHHHRIKEKLGKDGLARVTDEVVCEYMAKT